MARIFRTIVIGIIPLFLISLKVFAQGSNGAAISTVFQEISFTENKNQFHPNVHFKTKFKGGVIMAEEDQLTIALLKKQVYSKDKHKHDVVTSFEGYAMRLQFLDNNKGVLPKGVSQLPHYFNYFRGNDSKYWASKVRNYKGIKYEEIYNGIDFLGYGENGNFKYDFIVESEIEPSIIRLNYQGAKELKLDKSGNLLIKTNDGFIQENRPYAYQFVNGIKQEVPCQFELYELGFGFKLGEYDFTKKLIIDPQLVASTYNGGWENNFGHCSTYDSKGKVYLGAVLHGDFDQNIVGRAGYPTTDGAFSVDTYGALEVIISKFDETGTVLEYGTFIGGSSNENVHSLIVNDKNELYILGTTSSLNFPLSEDAYSKRINGGMDMFITKLSEDGSTLLGSTYIGGSGSDGFNLLSATGGYSYGKYGDAYRGEIIVDENDNCFVINSTSSKDFPVTRNAIQQNSKGAQDVVVFKMNENLSELTWATYLSGSRNDAGYGIKKSNRGTLYVTGTASETFPESGGVKQGGLDGFIAEISENGERLIATYFIGGPSDDQNYFVDTDPDGGVYVLGTSVGGINQSQDHYYGGGNGNLFIAKLDADLKEIEFVSTNKTLVPAAFMVDNCYNIYVSGHSGAKGGLRGYNLTADAFQARSGGFYLMVLDKDAQNLKYASYFGNTSAHVDGGTSRFDKKGIVYQAMCVTDGVRTLGWAAYTESLAKERYSGFVFKLDFQQTTYVNIPNRNLIFCATEPVVLREVEADRFERIEWKTDGKGELKNSDKLQPVYIPALEDIGNEVNFYVEVNASECSASIDSLQISFLSPLEIRDTVWECDSVLPMFRVKFLVENALGDVYVSQNEDTINLQEERWFVSDLVISGHLYNLEVSDSTLREFGCIPVRLEGTKHCELKCGSYPKISVPEKSKICIDEIFTPENIQVKDYVSNGDLDQVLWTHDGKGELFNPTSLTPAYVPKQDDRGRTVNFTIIAFSGEANQYYCPNDTTVYEIEFTDPIELKLPSDTILCMQEIVDLKLPILENVSTFQWSHNSLGWIESSGSKAYYHTVNQDKNTSLTFVLEAFPETPCKQSLTDSFSVQIVAMPELNAGTDVAVCENSLRNVEVKGVAANFYENLWWSAKGTSDSQLTQEDAFTPVYHPSKEDGGKSITLYFHASPMEPCLDTVVDSVRISVKQVPEFTVGPGFACYGDSVLLEVNPLVEYDSEIYDWYSDSLRQNLLATGQKIIFGPIFENRIVYVEPSRGCSDGKLTVGKIDVKFAPEAKFSSSITKIEAIDQELNLIDLTSGALGGVWYFGDGETGSYLHEREFIHQYSFEPGEAPSQVVLVLSVYNEFNCRDTAMQVIPVELIWDVYIPNAFTPNHDGLNDEFKVYGHGVTQKSFSIYNRWGDLIFYSEEDGATWNGRDYKMNNKGSAPNRRVAKSEVYVYVTELTNHDGETRTYRGEVTLVK